MCRLSLGNQPVIEPKIRKFKVRSAHNRQLLIAVGDFSPHYLAPPYSQKVTLASAKPLQARAFNADLLATNFLRSMCRLSLGNQPVIEPKIRKFKVRSAHNRQLLIAGSSFLPQGTA